VQSGWGSIELGADSGDRANCIGGKFAAARGSRRRGVGGGGGGGGGRRRRRGVGGDGRSVEAKLGCSHGWTIGWGGAMRGG
jgi:hypothetical protein